MNDLFDIKNIKGKFFFTILGVVIVLVLFVFGYMMPSRNKIAQFEDDLKNLEAQRRVAEQKVKDLAVLQANRSVIDRDKYTIAQLVPDKSNEAKIVEFIHYLAELHVLDVEIANFTEAVPLPLAKLADDKKSGEEKKLDSKLVRSLRRFQATVRVGGKFSDVVAFIREFKRSNRYFEIFSISIPEEETARALPDTYPISLDGYFYFYAEEVSGRDVRELTELERMIEAEGLGERYLESSPPEADQESAEDTTGDAVSEGETGNDSPGDSPEAADSEASAEEISPDSSAETAKSGTINGGKGKQVGALFDPPYFRGGSQAQSYGRWIARRFGPASTDTEVA